MNPIETHQKGPSDHSSESPQVFAKRIGIQPRGKSTSSIIALSWDACLDLAVIAYWQHRGDDHDRAA